MMKKLVFRLMPIIASVFSLQSCMMNEDYLSSKKEVYYSNKFQVFSSMDGKQVNYAKGFKTLLENYDAINKTYYTRASVIKSGNLGKSDKEYVEFGLHSQAMFLEEDERWIIYPMIQYDQVSGLIACILRNEETEVEFRKLDAGNDYYEEVFKIFSIAYIKNKLKRGLNNKGGCGFSSDTPCDIDDIVISPPKSGPKGNGPKSGCTGLNNCIKPDIGGGSGGAGSGYDPYAGLILPPPPKVTIKDIKDFLSCLNITQSANLTVYAEQLGNNYGVGHAFISIKQGNNTMIFGFYPKINYDGMITGPGIFGNDEGHIYTHSWNVGNITPTQLQQIIAVSISYSGGTYDLGFNNCADFTLTVLSYVGVSTNTAGVDTPYTVANLIKNKGGNVSNGNAPQTQRSCN
ncbi:hypothetical protein H5J24_13280 [Chryseobacterium capnotolerans]|uniref:hypothetical protein n=1 Tax=Chryseobacterium TaxID=59732 RepID=UPI000A88CCC5|nr:MULTISPECIES: hypothetical protein [Chryseobacterium]UHO36794.1 hypothetical protein H5J24_13280 [Chryseobacterium capnotolerans]